MSIQTSYTSKAAQTDALDLLNRQYDELRRGFDLDLPYSLCHYRPAKHDRLVSREIALQIKGMIVARDVIHVGGGRHHPSHHALCVVLTGS